MHFPPVAALSLAFPKVTITLSGVEVEVEVELEVEVEVELEVEEVKGKPWNLLLHQILGLPC
jgi:hypothetical protein